MKAKEKARELVAKFHEFSGENKHYNKTQWDYAKQCALIAVNQIINFVPNNDFELDIYKAFKIEPKYWTDVKNEIKKL